MKKSDENHRKGVAGTESGGMILDMEATERCLTLNEAAEVLQVSAATLRGWSQVGRFPGFRLGGVRNAQWRVRVDDLLDWISDRKRVTQRVSLAPGILKDA